ncbi:hypothetical protein AB0O18_20190 [Streptomyces sp. NPDC093224]|uniref:hypothetical protein n=1 Tax=Streptomyces sp. NPDC093224 TaxID=3155198 RepID=UPI003418F864
MSRPLRWAVVIAGTALVFLLCFRLGEADPFGWLPDKDSDKVAAAAGFGGAMAAAFGLAGAWWAGNAQQAEGGSSVRQRARASGSARIVQSGGAAAPGRLHQSARADGDSRVSQRAGDDVPAGAGADSDGAREAREAREAGAVREAREGRDGTAGRGGRGESTP